VFLGEADYFDVNLWDFSGLEPFYELPDSQVYTPLGAHPATRVRLPRRHPAHLGARFGGVSEPRRRLTPRCDFNRG
jgi:hypothetical protein